MSAMTGNREFIGYEYKEITADPGRISFLMDGYENFGWRPDENVMPAGYEQYPQRNQDRGCRRKAVIRLKRDRKIINKAELTRLQRNFEACVEEIDSLEKRKTSGPAVAAVCVGVAGTAFMAGSTFAVTAPVPMTALAVILAVPGFLGWILPYFFYQALVRRQTARIAPLIEDKYDEIYEICEKGSKLLL